MIWKPLSLTMANQVRSPPTISSGSVMSRRFLMDFCSSRKVSARISRALRKAVSPEVIGQTTTPATASTPPTTPSTPVEIS